MKHTPQILIALTLLLGACNAGEKAEPREEIPFENSYCFGADLSFVLQAEQRGKSFYDTDGTPASPWQIMRSHGFNWGRLMICSEPSRLGQNIDYVLQGAAKLKEHGYHFALDYMLSDDWSNPMTQPVPKSWQGKSGKELEQCLYDFVFSTLKQLKDADLLPQIVQIGNEISNGILWPYGRVFYSPEKAGRSHWEEFTSLLKAGIKAVKDVDSGVQIMLHADFGGDRNFSSIFFSKMQEYGVDYDIIGYSFYPWSHGTLADLRDNLDYTIKTFGKSVIVIETGYYSAPSDYFEKKGHMAAFPETEEGQRQWLEAVNEVVMGAADHKGLGVFWWEPMFGARGFFDKDGKARSVVDAFRKYALPLDRCDGNPRIWDFEDEDKR